MFIYTYTNIHIFYYLFSHIYYARHCSKYLTYELSFSTRNSHLRGKLYYYCPHPFFTRWEHRYKKVTCQRSHKEEGRGWIWTPGSLIPKPGSFNHCSLASSIHAAGHRLGVCMHTDTHPYTCFMLHFKSLQVPLHISIRTGKEEQLLKQERVVRDKDYKACQRVTGLENILWLRN